MSRTHAATAVAGKIGYVLGCVVAALILVTGGFAYYVKSQVASIGGSAVITGNSPSTGAMNILLMGLESRTYWSGQPLPKSLEDAMHIGSVGGQATNTLILIHIFPGGKRAVGFSIPRDDWVSMHGTSGYGGQMGKIDQAYGFALARKEAQVAGKGLSLEQFGYAGNEAGRLAEIQTVEALTGVHIDHFAELNLLGFYQLAKVFGGIEVCLKDRAYDPSYSGANIPAGYHLLNAAQALAFVRQRHNLPNGDLDRTHRQQAVVDYVIWKLQHQGVFADLSQLSSLLTVARQYMVTDSTWNLLDFLPQMRLLTGDNLSFSTLPIERYQLIDGQDVNVVNPVTIKQIVHAAFYPPPASPRPARAMPTHPKPTEPTVAADATAPGGHADTLAAALLSESATPSPAAANSAAETNAAGGAVTVSPNAPFGIPCVN